MRQCDFPFVLPQGVLLVVIMTAPLPHTRFPVRQLSKTRSPDVHSRTVGLPPESGPTHICEEACEELHSLGVRLKSIPSRKQALSVRLFLPLVILAFSQ